MFQRQFNLPVKGIRIRSVWQSGGPLNSISSSRATAVSASPVSPRSGSDAARSADARTAGGCIDGLIDRKERGGAQASDGTLIAVPRRVVAIVACPGQVVKVTIGAKEAGYGSAYAYVDCPSVHCESLVGRLYCPNPPEAPGGAPPTGEAPVLEQPAAATTESSQACVVVLPDFSVVDCNAVRSPNYAVLRDTACVPIITFDGHAAAVTATDNNLVAGWSFGVNFDAMSSDAPLGCLHLYHLDDGTKIREMVAVDQGGILVDTCTVNQPLTIANGEAQFCGSGSVTCELRLSDWFTDSTVTALVKGSDYALQNPLVDTTADISGLAVIGDVAPYPDLTLVAREHWNSPSPGTPRVCLQTLTGRFFNYTPDSDSTPQHALTLYMVEQGTTLTFEQNCLSQAAWDPGIDWNTTYSTLAIQSSGVNRHYENRYTLAGSTQPTESCDLAVSNDIEFWIGPGVLTIGALNDGEPKPAPPALSTAF